MCLISTNSLAQVGVGLDNYSCRQFLADQEEVAGSIKYRLAIHWAAGYAAAHQQGTPRADDFGLEIIAASLKEACRSSPEAMMTIVTAGIIASLFQDGTKQSTQQGNSGLESRTETSQAAGRTISPTNDLDGAFTTFKNYDIPAGDFRTLKNATLVACIQSCAAEAKCKAYSFDKWNGWCFLKSQVATLILDPSSIAGVRGENVEFGRSNTPQRIDRRPGKVLSGSNPKTESADVLEGCERRCIENATCLGYSFIKTTKVCKTFDSIDTFRPDRAVISGIKTQAP
jgi:hypothetical protein